MCDDGYRIRRRIGEVVGVARREDLPICWF